MAGFDPRYGFDPSLVNQANEALGGSYRVPVDTMQALTPEEAAFGQAQEAQAAAEDAYVASNPSHMGAPMQGIGQPAVEPPIPIDWVPSAAAPAPAPPVASTDAPQQAQPVQQQLRAPTYPSMGGGVRNPLPGMIDDAAARRTEAEQQRDAAATRGDFAADAAAEARMRTAQSQAGTAAGVGDIYQRLAGEGDEYRRQLFDAQDSHTKAAERVQNEQRDLTKFVSEYEPKDRRSGSSKIMGALAVGLGQMTDQNNLVAGLMQGMNVQTSNADSTVAMIQRGIDRDLEQQRAMLDNKKTALAAKGTELGQLRERYGDRLDTMKLGRSMKLDQAIQEMEAIKNRGLAGEALSTADEAIAKMQMERDDLKTQVFDQRFQQAYGDEMRLKTARYAQQQAAAAAQREKRLTPGQALDLEGKALANEKARRELEAGGGKGLTAEQLKRQSLFEGKDIAGRTIARLVAEGEAAPGVFGRNAPNWMRSAHGDEVDTAIAAMKDVLLRDESGASISEGDKKSKEESWGLDRGEAARKRGMRMMLDEYNARRRSVGLDEVSPVVRRGAR
jgi:hypothetical protein